MERMMADLSRAATLQVVGATSPTTRFPRFFGGQRQRRTYKDILEYSSAVTALILVFFNESLFRREVFYQNKGVDKYFLCYYTHLDRFKLNITA